MQIHLKLIPSLLYLRKASIKSALSLAFSIMMTFPVNALPLIQHGLAVTSVCPFTIANGPKTSTGDVVMECFTDLSCFVPASYTANYLGGNPTYHDGPHFLSNESLSTSGFSYNCSINSGGTIHAIQLTISTSNSLASVCMQATYNNSSNLWACSGGPYTLTLA